MQIFPVAGAEAPLFRVFGINIGEIGGNDAGGSLAVGHAADVRQRRVADIGEAAAYRPPPVPETQQAAQKRRAGVIQPPEQGDGFPGAGTFAGKCPPGKAAELFQRAAQQRVAADEMQFPDILILMLQPEFQRPQFIDGIEVGRHLGMTFV